ncbi:MAG TPA: NUDIX hydrolase [Phenylobacterium sp.]|nr:NUDIX hydrolase [Phenylobacterium sp.]
MSIELRKVETVYRGYSTLMVATLATADGTTFQREIEHHGRAVGVLPYDPARRTALLVSIPRAPVIWAGGPAELAEAPAGMIEDGEDPQACVRREALEEAGVRLGALEAVGSPFSSPGFSAERIDLFLAAYSRADRVSDGGGAAGEQENITVLELPLDELWARVEAREVEDLKTLALVLALRVRQPELFDA